jgi:uroporphyrinogen decarboxylase
MIKEVADYPVQGLSWHDRSAGPSLAEVAKIFPGTLVAGIEQFNVLHFETPAVVAAQVRDAIGQMGGRRLIVAAGCTYPLTAPECNLVAARKAVEAAPR